MEANATQLDRLERKLDAALAKQDGPAPRWLTIEGAAAYTSLSERTIRNLIQTGKLIARHPVRGRTVLDRHELDGFIASSTHEHRKGRGKHLATLKIAASQNGGK